MVENMSEEQKMEVNEQLKVISTEKTIPIIKENEKEESPKKENEKTIKNTNEKNNKNSSSVKKNSSEITRRKKSIWKIILQILLITFTVFVSFSFLSKISESEQFKQYTIEYLDKKTSTVMKLTAVSAAASVTASLALGERANPIANKLIDLTGYFLIILCSLMIEKFMLLFMGDLAFKFMIPLAGVIFLINIFLENETLNKICRKIAVFAILIFAIIPSSILLSKYIEIKFDYEKEVQQTLVETEQFNKEIGENIGSENIDINSEIQNMENSSGDLLGKFTEKINEAKKKISEIVQNTKDGIKTTITNIKDLPNKLTTKLNSIIKTIAIMIVTSCVIPIFVLLFFVWIVKLFFYVDLSTKIPKLSTIVNKK